MLLFGVRSKCLENLVRLLVLVLQYTASTVPGATEYSGAGVGKVKL